MEKDNKLALLTLSFLCTAAILPPLAHSTADSHWKVAHWFDHCLPTATQQTTHLHFYFHDILAGKNQTTVRITDPPDTNKYPTLFGSVNIIDDPLTEGPELGSEPVGRAQGLYGLADRDTLGLIMSMNLVFTGKKFNGSTLSVLGRNPVLETYREMPIVGGTGVFRLARGVATVKTVLMNATNVVAEYNVVVLHY